jgi:hypothetical protein
VAGTYVRSCRQVKNILKKFSIEILKSIAVFREIFRFWNVHLEQYWQGEIEGTGRHGESIFERAICLVRREEREAAFLVWKKCAIAISAAREVMFSAAPAGKTPLE